MGVRAAQASGSPLPHPCGRCRAVHTTSDGETIVDYPDAGESVWVDDGGITCRRWNWRLTSRTAIDHHTSRAGFIIDSFEAPDHASLQAAVDQLVALLPRALVRILEPAIP